MTDSYTAHLDNLDMGEICETCGFHESNESPFLSTVVGYRNCEEYRQLALRLNAVTDLPDLDILARIESKLGRLLSHLGVNA